MALNDIRRAELDRVAAHLPPAGRILEIGGGSGYQAHLLQIRGYDVRALDVDTRPTPGREYHSVEIFDGTNVPFPGASFDAVFSSNVLEHVGDLAGLLAETRRVLKPNGVAIHVMPTPTWRLWTSLAHYPEMARRALKRRAGPRTSRKGAAHGLGRAHSPAPGLRQYLVPGPHGTGNSAAGELLSFQAGSWKSKIEKGGFEVTRDEGCGLFYTGHLLLPELPIESRQRLAQALGSSCRIYVSRPR